MGYVVTVIVSVVLTLVTLDFVDNFHKSSKSTFGKACRAKGGVVGGIQLCLRPEAIIKVEVEL